MAIDFATYTERVLGQEIPAIPHTEAEIRWCRIAFDAGANWWEARDAIRESMRNGGVTDWSKFLPYLDAAVAPPKPGERGK